MKPKVIAIGGPTASGKSDLAKELLARYPSVAISVDSAQIYRGLDIGTGKDRTFPQKMLDILSPGTDFSVSQFAQMALMEINQVIQTGKIPILVGGSGYYLDALLYDKQFPEVHNPELLGQLEKMSTDELLERLRQQDPISFDRVQKNRRRTLRALEIIETTHQPVPKQEIVNRFQTCLLVLDPGKENLEKNITLRLDHRLKEGLIDEVRQLKKTVDNQWLETKAGFEYTYISLYLDNKLSYNSMYEHIIKDSLAYANRQRTWFRRYDGAVWVSNTVEAMRIVENFISEANIV